MNISKIVSNDQLETIETLFKLGTKDIEILNNDFNKAYKNYLKNQFKFIFLLKSLANQLKECQKVL